MSQIRTQKKDQEQLQQIDIDDQKQQSTNNAIIYGDVQIDMKCPHCLERIRTQIIMRPQFISVTLGMCIFAIIPHLATMAIVLLVMQVTASKKHRCPLCEQQLGSDGKFLLYFTDQVYSLQWAGLIFTKKLFLTVCMIIFTLFLLGLRLIYLQNLKWVDTTWTQYHSQCISGDVNYCRYKYKDKQFRDWSGYVLKIEDNRQSVYRWYLHGVSVYMKMDPPVSNDTKPDVLLTLSSETINRNSEVLKILRHGDQIKFNCSLHSRQTGTLKDSLHFHIDSIMITGHNNSYALYVPEIEEEWARFHLQDHPMLRSQPKQ